ncbi:cation:proton antiporter [Nonomuraea sp. NN258]|uniref:cation:proton antiporter n=1 Tax=Nonomuraea antri TaxID=2730852 RepID=UPI00156998CA|nr:cation:proton antiporter [Nonomuraea antri]NRQ31700.1 cation:proton antiporter [Nonomuraea antri]
MNGPAPAIAAGPLLLFLLQLGALLAVALLLGRAAVALRMPAVVGELAAGLVLGPLGWLFPPDPAQFHLVDAVAQVGVLLLVGVTGAHLDLRLIRRQGTTIARLSAFGLVIPLAMGVAAGLMLPVSIRGPADATVFALFLGVAMCVSAIPVIAKTLHDMNLLHRNVGQLTLTAGMIDDAFGWLMLSVVSGMATFGVRAGSVAASVAALAGVLLVAVVAGRPLVRATFWLTGRYQDSSPTIIATVVIVLLSAAGTHVLGMEPVLGAFVAGLLISAAAPDPARLAPLRTVVLGLLAPLYFATVGLRMDLAALMRPEVLWVAVVMVSVAFAGKFLGAFLGAWTSRMNRWEALALGAGMNARGVIQVIVATVGLRLGVLTVEMYTIIILVAMITSVLAPPILRLAMARVEQTAEEKNRRMAQGLAPAREES